MENTEKKPTGIRKIVGISALLLILVVLPVGTWFYLRGGLNWHREAVKELRDYGKIRPLMVILPNGERFDDLEGKVCVIYNFGDDPQLNDSTKRILDIYQKLFEQFGMLSDESVRVEFRLVPIFENGSSEFRSYFQTLPASDYATMRRSAGLGSWRTILDNGYERFCRDEHVTPTPYYFAITDTKGVIRRFYDATDEKQISRMVEQIALLLPKN